ncbi:hypothetical protein EBR11_06280 [bacterium]|nr:hypothetical protein [bacterium]
MLAEDRPRERLVRLGPRALLDSELFELLIGVGTRGASAQQVSRSELAAAMELARRLRERTQDPGDKLDTPAKVWSRLEPITTGLSVEKCWVLCLNRRNRLIALQEISSGTATSSLLHPREVFRQALRYGAPAAIVAHNHPSGDPSPSSADRAVTRQLAEAGRILGVELLDHVIVGRPESDPTGKGWFSFGEAGLL